MDYLFATIVIFGGIWGGYAVIKPAFAYLLVVRIFLAINRILSSGKFANGQDVLNTMRLLYMENRDEFYREYTKEIRQIRLSGMSFVVMSIAILIFVKS